MSITDVILLLTQRKEKISMITSQKTSKGFTLMELMIAIALSAIVLSGIFAFFRNQVVTNNTERAMVTMQQNARAAVSIMEKEIRMARYDPTGNANSQILTANGARIQFESDNIVEDGVIVPGETITYALSQDADNNGIADVTPCDLVRIIDTGNPPPNDTQTDIVAFNIDALNFDYFDSNGNLLTNKGALPWTVPGASIPNIASVQVSIVARSGATLPVFFKRQTDVTVYRNRSGDIILPVQNDDFRRMHITTEIDCRN